MRYTYKHLDEDVEKFPKSFDVFRDTNAQNAEAANARTDDGENRISKNEGAKVGHEVLLESRTGVLDHGQDHIHDFGKRLQICVHSL